MQVQHVKTPRCTVEETTCTSTKVISAAMLVKSQTGPCRTTWWSACLATSCSRTTSRVSPHTGLAKGILLSTRCTSASTGSFSAPTGLRAVVASEKDFALSASPSITRQPLNFEEKKLNCRRKSPLKLFVCLGRKSPLKLLVCLSVLVVNVRLKYKSNQYKSIRTLIR